jgi:quercetin dioxygenase-like cupin family protein
MKLYLVVLAMLIGGAILTAGDAAPRSVIFIGHDKVAAALAHSESLIAEPDFLVMGSHREVAGRVEMHDKENDIFYITDGEATFITGGKMVGGHVTKPGQWMGSDIAGGETHHLVKGDVITIRAGIPHWFKEVPHSVTYFVVKVLNR